ncbi:unnamed protein product [Porites lobata]|uniref:Exonuclease domain-containing protein n=1 Tax=Porites lobata TaxID=104759 RepID=A0ABN8Q250_9CNID|nr:unnamed protein product [Porites lobata]
MERDLSENDGQGEGPVAVGVYYDMGWRKRGKSYDSSSGVGTAVGLKTGKVISYATRNTLYRVCQEAVASNREPTVHDCRRNHEGSSKSMEANVAVQLFGDAVEGGVRYSTYVGDDDSTTENRLQSLVAYDTQKWSDINHASRTLGSRLYAVKSKVKSLSPAVIGYIQRCFTYCIRQNKGKESSLLEGLKSIVPHAFGEHTLCKEWCTYKHDPENYSHGDLPGGRDLQGDDLRASIEDAMKPFLTEELAKKLAPCGSSQRNECVNSLIGLTQSEADRLTITNGTLSDLRSTITDKEFDDYVSIASLQESTENEEETGTPNGPFVLAICDTETTGLGMECEIIQLSCLVQGKAPFNQYLLPDKKMILESATKIHGVSVRYQNGAKQLHKNGSQLLAVSQAQGLGNFLSFIKEVGSETRVVFVAHNGNRFDFPILLRSMKGQGLLEQFLECRPMLLDSLEVITKEKKARRSHLKECKGKSLATVYEKLFGEQFNAHDSLEDVVALGRVLHSNKLQQTLEGMVAHGYESCCQRKKVYPKQAGHFRCHEGQNKQGRPRHEHPQQFV